MQKPALLSLVLLRTRRGLPGLWHRKYFSSTIKFASLISQDRLFEKADRFGPSSKSLYNTASLYVSPFQTQLPTQLVSTSRPLQSSQQNRQESIPSLAYSTYPRRWVPPVGQSGRHKLSSEYSSLQRPANVKGRFRDPRAEILCESKYESFITQSRRAFKNTQTAVSTLTNDREPSGDPFQRPCGKDDGGGRNDGIHTLEGGEGEAEQSFNRLQLERLEQSVRQNEKMYGGDHFAVADACLGCAIAFIRAERGVEAEGYCERVLAVVNKDLENKYSMDEDGGKRMKAVGAGERMGGEGLEANLTSGGEEAVARVNFPGKSRAEVIQVASEAFLQLGLHFATKDESLSALKWAKTSKQLLLSTDSGDIEGKEFLLAMSDTCQGMALMELGQLDAATSAAESALEILSVLMGPGHVFVAQARYNVAHAYVKTGRLEDAAVMLRDSLKVRRKALGRSHPDAILATKRCLFVALKLGNEEESKECLEELKFFGEEIQDGWV